MDLEQGDASDRSVDMLNTAILFQTAAEAGCVVGRVGDDLLALLGRLGAQVGCCYQLLEDLEDYPVRDDTWMSRRAAFETELAVMRTTFREMQPHLSDARALELWLNRVWSFDRP